MLSDVKTVRCTELPGFTALFLTISTIRLDERSLSQVVQPYWNSKARAIRALDDWI